MGPEIVFESAQISHERGEIEDARSRLEWLSTHHDSPQVQLEFGKVLELFRDYESAIVQYEHLTDSWPESSEATLAHFRRVICLQDIDKHRQALRAVKRLSHQKSLDEESRAVVALIRGSSEIALDRSRRGVPRVRAALTELENTDRTWHRARGRVWLMRHLVRESRALSLKRERQSIIRQPERLRLLDLADQQLMAINRLQIPEFTVEGFLVLGMGLEELSVDFSLTQPSWRASAEEKSSMLQEIQRYSEAYLRRAWELYDRGLDNGIRHGVKGPEMDEIRQRRDAISGTQGSTGKPATD